MESSWQSKAMLSLSLGLFIIQVLCNDYEKQYVRNIDNSKVNVRLRKLGTSFILKKKTQKQKNKTKGAFHLWSVHF